jgi:hypothetical protein
LREVAHDSFFGSPCFDRVAFPPSVLPCPD